MKRNATTDAVCLYAIIGASAYVGALIFGVVVYLAP